MKTKTENLVCTQVQAIELKKLGIVQYSIFYFGAINSTTILFVNNDLRYIPLNNCYSKPGPSLVINEECASAYTITELTPIIRHLTNKAFELPEQYKEKYKGIDEMVLLFNSEFITDLVLSALEQKVITVEQINRMLID